MKKNKTFVKKNSSKKNGKVLNYIFSFKQKVDEHLCANLKTSKSKI